MPIDSSARAALLAGALVSSPLPETLLERRVNVPAIRMVVPQQRPPLNLDAAIFRYRLEASGRVTVIDEPAGARFCRLRCKRS